MRFSLSSTLIGLVALSCAVSAEPIPSSPTSHKPAKTAKDFFVDGKHIPGVPFAVSDSYAGLLPISGKKNESREFFFWWYPAEGNVGKDDLTIWLNGGPGCSSLEGLLQENGPWLLPFNTTKVVKNPYSWTKLSNVLWIEQPVSVGLGKGTPDITDENGVADQFYGFLVQFFKTFPELKHKKLYITGESYAGKYIPYISGNLLSKPPSENKETGVNFQGMAINDPSFANDVVTEQIPAVEFAVAYQKILGLNDSTIANLKQMAKQNGVDNFVAKNLHYPPKGPIKLPAQLSPDYDAFDYLINAATDVNPCFNIYQIEYKCPGVTDALGFPPQDQEPSANNFINNSTGLKAYIHADPNQVWYECVNGVFLGNGDRSPAPADTNLLRRVIEQSPSKRTVIQHGELDAVLIANGSALAIQNTTWNGKQGLQKPLTKLIVDGKQAGHIQSERGLTFARIDNSGHMVPQDVPKTAFKLQKYVLGQISYHDLLH